MNPYAWPKIDDSHQGGPPYEADHHLLYTANAGGGLWRMVTQ